MTVTRQRRFLHVGLLALLATCCHCGCNKYGTVKLAATVTLDGKPLEGAAVRFHRIDDSSTRGASGITDSEGVVRLTTFEAGDGVLPGEYLVTVSKQDDAGEMDVSLKSTPAPEGETEQEAEARKIRDAMRAEALAGVVPRYSTAVPRKYRLRKESPLRCTVPPDGDVRFELSSE